MSSEEEILTFPDSTTVLIVDDEELMREVAAIMVEDHGGAVLTAVDGVDAVEVFEQNLSAVSCIVMDFSMPRMNGYEAALEIRKKNSDVPIIIVSGLAVTPEIENMVKKGELEYMSKPFHEQSLIEAISGAIKK